MADTAGVGPSTVLVAVTVKAVLVAVIPRLVQPLRFRAAAIFAAEELAPPLGVATAPNPPVISTPGPRSMSWSLSRWYSTESEISANAGTVVVADRETGVPVELKM